MKNNLLLCVLLIISSITPIFAQPTIDGNYVVPEPQIWSFMKYGGSQPNLYTGTVSASIPIYTYKDNDFTIPISLSYASNGYVPNVQASEIGLGWFLNAGGCVTREVRILPDDYSKGDNRFGYHYINSVGKDSNPFNRGVFTIPGFPDCYYKSSSMSKAWVETEPDIYHFNFCGYTGSFVQSENGQYIFNASSPYGTFKISNLGGNTLTITTGDGYEYSFGGSSMPNNYGRKDAKYRDSNRPTTEYERVDIQDCYDTWLLTQIKAPNGRRVVFKYSQMCQTMTNIRPGGRRVVGNSGWNSGSGCDIYEQTDLSEIYRMWYKNYTVQLEKISIEDVLDITFEYNNREYENGYFLGGATVLETLPKLYAIEVISKQDNKRIKRCDLQYSYSKSDVKLSNKIMFLTSLNISGEGKYTMKYHDLDNYIFPCHGTVSIDHWGYHNRPADYELTGLIPTVNISANFEETITNLNRTPNSNYSKKGILEVITYPTGGYTTFDYESHMYSKFVTRDYTSQNIPYLKDTPTPSNAGGVRIRKITDYDGKQTTSREYLYINGNHSSGILLNRPRYYYHRKLVEIADYGWKQEYNNQIWTTEALFSYCMDKTHIEYTQVIEKFDNGSSIKYKFANYQDYPDIYSITETRPKGPLTAVEPKFANNYLRKPDYINSIRGKLLSKVYYNNSGDSLKGIYYRYDTNKELGTILGIEKGEDAFYIHPTVIRPNSLISTSTIDYTAKGAIEKNISYTYNRLGQATGVKQFNSDGSTLYDSIRYISNVSFPSGSPEDIMLGLNMLDYPINKIRTIQRGLTDVKHITDAAEYKYQCIKIKEQDKPIPVLASIQRAELTGEQSPGDVLSYNNEIRCTYFDAAGNVLETIDKANVPTTYIWGYNGRYLVAKIVNCSLSNVSKITGLTLLRTLPLSNGLPKEAQSRLYDMNTIKHYGYMATVYDYAPFFGISQLTDMSGRTISYVYDPYGRLEVIKDDTGSPVEGYQYHYKIQ